MSARWLRHLGAWAAAALLAVPVVVQAQSLPEGWKQIERRAKLSVCSTMGFPLFAYYDAQQRPAGLVPDLISDIHQRAERKLGKTLALEIVRVTPVNRIEFLRQGRCDFMVSTLSRTTERLSTLDFAEPGFYRSGWTVLALKSTPISKWEDLRGKKLCAAPTNSWARIGERRYGIQFVNFSGGEIEAQRALLDGRCLGTVAFDTFFEVTLAKDPGRWEGMEIKLPSQDWSYWTISTRTGRPELVGWLSQQVQDWHRSGLIARLEKKHGIRANEWVAQQQQAYARPAP